MCHQCWAPSRSVKRRGQAILHYIPSWMSQSGINLSSSSLCVLIDTIFPFNISVLWKPTDAKGSDAIILRCQSRKQQHLDDIVLTIMMLLLHSISILFASLCIASSLTMVYMTCFYCWGLSGTDYSEKEIWNN